MTSDKIDLKMLKRRAAVCVTHFYACDCREYAYKSAIKDTAALIERHHRKELASKDENAWKSVHKRLISLLMG